MVTRWRERDEETKNSESAEGRCERLSLGNLQSDRQKEGRKGVRREENCGARAERKRKEPTDTHFSFALHLIYPQANFRMYFRSRYFLRWYANVSSRKPLK